MLRRNLTEQSAECLYGDKRLADFLWQYLQSAFKPSVMDGWKSLQERLFHLLVEGIEARFPREHRLTDIRQLCEHICGEHLLLTGDLPWLEELQKQLLIRDGDFLCYPPAKVQAYVRHAAGLDPTLLAAWHFIQWLENISQPAPSNIRRVISSQLPFFAPLANSSMPFAEGHVHFWGVTADSVILDDCIFNNKTLSLSNEKNSWQKEQYTQLIPLIERARQLLNWLIEQQQQKNPKQESVFLNINPMDNKLTFPDWGLLAESFITSQSIKVNSPAWLLGEFAFSMKHRAPNRWLWLYLYLCGVYRSPSTEPLKRVAVLCFWQTINILRRSLIMDGQGLTRFAERYFAAALGRGRDLNPIDNINRTWASSKDVAEIKGSPLAFNALAKTIARNLLNRMEQGQSKPLYIFGENEQSIDAITLARMQTLERWQFCGHFSRSVFYQQNKRAKPNRKALWKTAKKLIGSLENAADWSDPEFLGGKLNPHFHFQPARWFRGLDVAGDENALKIEYFAPILRWLRKGFSSMAIRGKACTGFHLSIHAGEDYAHPVSGLRHIDETVRFCEMREGDRLGHALALGVEPKLWVERQGQMLLSFDEHLDNLIWLWHYSTKLSHILPLAEKVQPILARRLERFWKKSLWWQEPNRMKPDVNSNTTANKDFLLRHATKDDLFESWCLRRNCFYSWKESFTGRFLTDLDKVAIPDYQELKDNKSLAAQLYFARHTWMESGSKAPSVIVLVANNESALNYANKKREDNLLEDEITIAELEFMHALQDYLLTEYDKLGLIIETNPTSNVYIARLNSHAEHPIFRWNPPDESVLNEGASANLYNLRKGPVRVLVNTDDPGIMPTTLYTEFLLLREAAIELKIGRTVAERWLEGLRQYGMEQFNRNHLPVFEPIL